MIYNSILNMNKDNEDEKIDTIKELKSLKSKLWSNNEDTKE